ncbi:enoyl-CoA-hydratase DpgB [Kitasatospora kifunensis]|uniref:Isomerase DpgB n=1 Tax=Kitasatospora kifunensis TaxID=58351 RepID=A0A7W7R966_KITKI|nr:enoyl-CoA-hydratase DpgB [Kitasatospora kifunensis]MBB4927767.1 isomerase DpgB [Kitasatospora kifunensis]
MNHLATNHAPEPLVIDGARPLSAEAVQSLNELCAQAEDALLGTPVVLRVSGAPAAAAVPTLPTAPLALVNKWERALRRLERLDVPTVALATGDCGGTALEALLATDYRIADPATRLLPGDADGVWPGMALYRLTNQAGLAATRRSVLFGTAIPAEHALTLHLLDQLADDPSAALATIADTLTATAGAGLAIRRQLMHDAATTSFEEALGRHLAACDRVLRQATAEVAS